MGVVNKFEMTSMCMFAAPIYSLCGFNYSFLSDNDLVMEHGLGFEALKIFDQMANAGVKPDKVTFVCSSCLQPLRSSRSHKLFNQMTREFQIKPQLRNYSSMADLFGRDGLLEEARWILKSMPTEPSWPYVQTRVDSLRTARSYKYEHFFAKCKNRRSMTSAFSWIKADETAKEALVRILTERPFLVLPPPLHRLPLRAGNIVEIVGASPSAKTLILIQAAINCILPKEWRGVQYGGLERAVLFIDLDCRFDVSSISRALQRRIIEANGLKSSLKGSKNECDKELFAACMRRFLYTRCYNSFEFLATLKTLHYRIQQEKEKQSSAVYMLLIDSIGAFYWMDRALPSSSTGNNNRKNLSLQTVVETIVHEIQRLLLVHPMVVIATKSAAFADKQSTTEAIRKRFNDSKPDPRGSQNTPHREFMPSVWQSFVSHRMLLQTSDGESKNKNHPIFSTEWLLPSLKSSDHFTVTDDGLLVTI